MVGCMLEKKDGERTGGRTRWLSNTGWGRVFDPFSVKCSLQAGGGHCTSSPLWSGARVSVFSCAFKGISLDHGGQSISSGAKPQQVLHKCTWTWFPSIFFQLVLKTHILYVPQASYPSPLLRFHSLSDICGHCCFKGDLFHFVLRLLLVVNCFWKPPTWRS